MYTDRGQISRNVQGVVEMGLKSESDMFSVRSGRNVRKFKKIESTVLDMIVKIFRKMIKTVFTLTGMTGRIVAKRVVEDSEAGQGFFH